MAQGEVLKPAGEGTATDPMENALSRLRAEITLHERTHGDYVKQARIESGIAHPITIDGCRALLDHIEAMVEAKAGK